MFNKILGWTILVITIIGIIYQLVNLEESWLFVASYGAGIVYITAKYLESLK